MQQQMYISFNENEMFCFKQDILTENAYNSQYLYTLKHLHTYLQDD